MLLAALACLVVADAAPGVAGLDPASEVVVVDLGGAVGAPAPLPARGRFGVVDHPGGAHLALTASAPWGDSYGLWSACEGFSDGLVRARLRVGARLDAAVLVRARAAAAAIDDTGPELDGGYGVSFEGGRVRLVRWEHRVPRFLGAEEKLDPAPAAGGVVEVVVVATGPFLMATVYDEDFTRLAHVAVVDRGFVMGGVGVRVARGQDDVSGLLWLSCARAGGTASATPPALTMDGEGTGAGADRVVGVAEADVARLPADLQAKKILVEDGVALFALDPVGVERVRRARVPLLRHVTQIPFKFVDKSFRAREGKPPTRTATGFRADESYKDPAMVEALLRAWADRFPKITRLTEIGRSRENRPILALLISKNAAVDEPEPAVLLDGAHHGGELLSTEVVLDAIQQLVERYGRDKEITRLVDAVAIWCVPLVNVDGNWRYIHLTRDYDRKNARDVDDNGRVDGWDGVDLYRNYPVRWGGLGEIGSRSWPIHYRYRGPEAASEPEIQAMMRLAQQERFVASIDFHTNATKILVPYTDPSLTNPNPNEAWIIAEEIAKKLPMQTNRKFYDVARNLYPVDGTAQDWFRFSFGTVALLVELPQHNPLPYERSRNGNVLPSRGTWLELLRRVVDGPALEIAVTDADGAPVEVAVDVREMATMNGERWTTRPRDGHLWRLLPAPGTYTVVLEKDGHTTRRSVEVPPGVARTRVSFTWPSP